MPSIQHNLRAMPAAISAVAAAQHDADVLEDIATHCGLLTAEELKSYPLVAMSTLPQRLGGRGVTSAATLAPIAHIAGQAQAARVIASAGPNAPDALPINLSRLSGRPAWGAPDPTVVCQGEARCRMPRAKGCKFDRCACCCVLAEKSCKACRTAGDKAGELPEQMNLMPRVTDEVERIARTCGASTKAVYRAVALGCEFTGPQRAISCAVWGRMRERLKKELPKHARDTLESMSNPGAYAVFGPPTLAPLSNDAFCVALRTAYDIPVLDRKSIACTAACKTKVDLSSPHAADEHAQKCKLGGEVIAAHNDVCSAIAKFLGDCGVGVGTGVARLPATGQATDGPTGPTRRE